jgi:peptide/nickel transport system substrate-binding protein
MQMRLNRRQFGLLSATALALIALPARLAFAQPSGTVTQASLEPAVLTGIERNGPETIATKILEGLIDFDADLNPIPALATSWEASADGLTHTFKLREGVKWHDGKDFTSADVAYSLLTLKEVHPRRRATFANLTSVDTPDPLTAVLVFAKPVPFLYGALGANGAPIFPRHLYEGVELATNPVQSAPVGTGPYVFKEWARGSHVLVERNPNYWNPEQPLLERVVLRFIPDVSAKVAALETGELDFDRSTIPFSEVDRLKTVSNLAVTDTLKSQGGGHHQFFFNLDVPVLQDIRVRQAIAHSLDVDELIRTVYRGYAKPAPSVIGPNQPEFHNPDIKPYAFDIAKANALLDEAGLEPGADGIRFSVRILHNAWTDLTGKSAEFLRSALQPLGIRGEVVNYDYATYVTKVYTDRDFDIEVETLANGYDPTDGVQRGYWSKAFKPGVPWSNAAHYTNARVDEIFETASAENDPEKRKALYFELQQIVYDELPSVGLVAPNDFAVHSKRLADALINQSGNLAAAHLVEV